MGHNKQIAPSRRQRRYIRYLERACDIKPIAGLRRQHASERIGHLEKQYRMIYDRQPMMRAR